ncbi:hypothetical protein [Caballeronia mineralivorans]|jgi:hypothetical protein|uniref:hypothetical protein n=1 Tax=Caballeronia mineralivorans TaxID=2010198 RepID=UPI0023F2EBFE|nr:hypothetical protein [Caballeronia mineralivorans]MDB5780361.1 hypothetical protein [Caballeronia mineralivorans]MEA3103650.1 hypothetical protein [Caballeronia mineralivorans]
MYQKQQHDRLCQVVEHLRRRTPSIFQIQHNVVHTNVTQPLEQVDERDGPESEA